LNTIFTVP